MRAAVYYGNSKLSVEDVPEPDVTDGHVKVKVSRNGICGTDLHEYWPELSIDDYADRTNSTIEAWRGMNGH